MTATATAPRTTRTVAVRELGEYELGLLDRVTGSAVAFGEQGYQAQATVAFVDRNGFVITGPVRCARRQQGAETRYEVVYAGGCVASVTVDAILSVTYGTPVPEYGAPSVRLEVPATLVVVDPARAGSHGYVPWQLTCKTAREEAAELAR